MSPRVILKSHSRSIPVDYTHISGYYCCSLCCSCPVVLNEASVPENSHFLLLMPPGLLPRSSCSFMSLTSSARPSLTTELLTPHLSFVLYLLFFLALTNNLTYICSLIFKKLPVFPIRMQASWGQEPYLFCSQLGILFTVLSLGVALKYKSDYNTLLSTIYFVTCLLSSLLMGLISFYGS